MCLFGLLAGESVWIPVSIRTLSRKAFGPTLRTPSKRTNRYSTSICARALAHFNTPLIRGRCDQNLIGKAQRNDQGCTRPLHIKRDVILDLSGVVVNDAAAAQHDRCHIESERDIFCIDRQRKAGGSYRHHRAPPNDVPKRRFIQLGLPVKNSERRSQRAEAAVGSN